MSDAEDVHPSQEGGGSRASSPGRDTKPRRRRSTIKSRKIDETGGVRPGRDREGAASDSQDSSRRQTLSKRTNRQHHHLLNGYGAASGSGSGGHEEDDEYQRAYSSSVKMGSPLSSLHRSLSNGSSPSASFSLSSGSRAHDPGVGVRDRRAKRLSNGGDIYANLRTGAGHALTLDRTPFQGSQNHYGTERSVLGLSSVDAGSSSRHVRNVSAGLTLNDLASRIGAGGVRPSHAPEGSSSASVRDILNEIDIRDALRMIQGSDERARTASGKSDRDQAGTASMEDVRIRQAQAEARGPTVPNPASFGETDLPKDSTPSSNEKPGGIAQDAIERDNQNAASKNKSPFRKKRRFFSLKRKGAPDKSSANNTNAAEMAADAPHPLSPKGRVPSLDSHKPASDDPNGQGSKPKDPAEQFDSEIQQARNTLTSSPATLMRAQKVRTTLEEHYDFIYSQLVRAQFSSPGAPSSFHGNPYNPLKAVRMRQEHLDLESMLRKSAVSRRAAGRRSRQHTAMNSVESFGEMQVMNLGNHAASRSDVRSKVLNTEGPGGARLSTASSVTDLGRLPFATGSTPPDRYSTSRSKTHQRSKSSKNHSVATLGNFSVFEDQPERNRSPWRVSVKEMQAAERIDDNFYQTSSNQTETSFADSIEFGGLGDKPPSQPRNPQDLPPGTIDRQGALPSNGVGALASPVKLHESHVQIRDMIDTSQPGEPVGWGRRGSNASQSSDSSLDSPRYHSGLSRTSPNGPSPAASNPQIHEPPGKSISWSDRAHTRQAHKHSRSLPLLSRKRPESKGEPLSNHLEDGESEQHAMARHAGSEMVAVTNESPSYNMHHNSPKDWRKEKPGKGPVKGVKGIFFGTGGLSSMHRSENHKNQPLHSQADEPSYQEFTVAAAADGKVLADDASSTHDEDLSMQGRGFLQGDFPDKDKKMSREKASGPPIKAVELIYVQKRALELDEMLNIINVFNPHIEHIHGVLDTQLGTCQDFIERIRDMELDIPLNSEELELLKSADQDHRSTTAQAGSGTPISGSDKAPARSGHEAKNGDVHQIMDEPDCPKDVVKREKKTSIFEMGCSRIGDSIQEMGKTRTRMEKRLQSLKSMQDTSRGSIKELADEINSIQSGINEGTYQNLKSLEDYFVKLQRSGSRSNASAALSLINGSASGSVSGGAGGTSTISTGLTGWLIDVGFGLLSWIVITLLWIIWFVVGVGKIVTWPLRAVLKLLRFILILAAFV